MQGEGSDTLNMIDHGACHHQGCLAPHGVVAHCIETSAPSVWLRGIYLGRCAGM